MEGTRSSLPSFLGMSPYVLAATEGMIRICGHHMTYVFNMERIGLTHTMEYHNCDLEMLTIMLTLTVYVVSGQHSHPQCFIVIDPELDEVLTSVHKAFLNDFP